VVPEVFSLKEVTYRGILDVPELVIPGSSFFAVTGKSGSGKSTLLKLLNNLISCDRGTILYHGRNLNSFDPVILRRKVVMVPQAPYIFPGTLEDNIRLAFYFNRKESTGQAALKDLLAIFGLHFELDQHTANLSGGEKQRLALIRAILLEPDTILLDEPTAALDDENARKAIGYFVDWVKNKHKTAVLVSHDSDLLKSKADWLLTLANGKVDRLEQLRG
jgi:putative ABC transport system ATP-binding protein